jgi:spermidine synthase
MMAGLLLHEPPWPRNALLIGLGAGSLTKFMHRNLPETRLTVIEIEPAVLIAARQFFRLPDEDARLRIQIDDGASYVAETRKRYDYILVDGFDRNARAGQLDTAPFYAACRAALSTGGVLAVNLFGRGRGFKTSFARLADAFDGRALAFPSCDSGNVIALACDGEPVDIEMDELRARADALKQRTALNLRPSLSRLQLAAPLAGNRLRI